MTDSQIVEQIWVSVAEAAERTGFHPDHVRRLARENWRLPEAERAIRLRKEANEYAIWLPDLMTYISRDNPLASQSNLQADQKIWVNTTEAAQLTGYNRIYLQKIASKYWKMPEKQRPIQVFNRLGRYEMWLPDLIAYLSKPGRGPFRKGPEKE